MKCKTLSDFFHCSDAGNKVETKQTCGKERIIRFSTKHLDKMYAHKSNLKELYETVIVKYSFYTAQNDRSHLDQRGNLGTLISSSVCILPWRGEGA